MTPDQKDTILWLSSVAMNLAMFAGTATLFILLFFFPEILGQIAGKAWEGFQTIVKP